MTRKILQVRPDALSDDSVLQFWKDLTPRARNSFYGLPSFEDSPSFLKILETRADSIPDQELLNEYQQTHDYRVYRTILEYARGQGRSRP